MSRLIVQISEDTELNQVCKVNLPEEFYIENLNHGDIQFPLYFEIKKDSTKINASVLEFTSAENTIEIPYFMSLADDLSSSVIQNDDMVTVTLIRNVIPCKSLTLEPLKESFFQKEDYVSFLEKELSKLSILYLNQIFYIFDNEMNNYPIKVISIEPDDDVNFCEYNTMNQFCYSIVNQNIDTEIINNFERKRLMDKRDRLREQKERVQMQKEDILSKSCRPQPIPIQGRRLSDENISISSPNLEDIRQARLRRFVKQKNENLKKEK